MRRSKYLKMMICVILTLGLVLPVNMVAFAGSGSSDPGVKDACTTFFIGKDLTENGSYIWGRTEDFTPDYAKRFTVIPAADHEPGDIYLSSVTSFSWPYPAHTLRYTTALEALSNDEDYGDEPYIEASLNEKGVAVSATVTLSDPLDEVMDIDPVQDEYTDIEWEDITGIGEGDIPSMIAMQAVTAREGCEIIAEIIDSEGTEYCEGFMVGDPNEVWYFQILSGHEYIAVKCPDDMLGFTPNITGNVDNVYKIKDLGNGEFDYDEDCVIVSPGLFSTADEAGTLVTDKDGNIKVADSYANPVDPEKLTRMWIGYNNLKSRSAANAIETTLYNGGKGGGFIDFLTDPRANAKTTKKYSLYDAMGLLAERGAGTAKDVDAPKGAPEDKRTISHIRNLEAHIFEVRQDMPVELTTVEWFCMGPTEFGVYLPFYGSLINDTFESYQGPESGFYDEDLDANSVYWVARELYKECIGGEDIFDEPNSRADREKYGAGVKAFWERYQKSLIAQQSDVDKYMAKLLAEEGRAAAETVATEVSILISEEMYNYTEQILAELKEFKEAGTSGNFTPSALADKDALPNYAGIIGEIDYSADAVAVKSNNILILNGEEMSFPAVKIKGYNWLKLRDVAMILSETEKEFSVGYDSASKTISLTTGEGYEPIGDELEDLLTAGELKALKSKQTVMLDGEKVNITAYNIDGYNYFRLRDLAGILDFGIDFDNASGKITLNLEESYTE